MLPILSHLHTQVQCRDLNCHEGLRVVSREHCEPMVNVEHVLNCSLIELYTKLSPQESNILSFISQHGYNFSNSLFGEARKISIANMLKLQIFETEHYVNDYTERVYIAVYWTMLVTPDRGVWHEPLMDVLKIFHDAYISFLVDGNYQIFKSEVVSPFFTSDSDTMLWHFNDNITLIKDRLDPIAVIDDIDNSTENQCTGKAFSKLFVCPFIEIGLNEISFKQNETFLIIGDTDRPIVLADWQYVMTNGSLQVCVDDFQIISNSIHWHSIRDEVDQK